MIGQKTCAVIGYGSWATALVSVLSSNEVCVYWYVRNPEVSEGLRLNGHNPKYLQSLKLDMTKIDVSDNVDYVVGKSDMVLISIPSAYLKSSMEPLAVPLKGKIVISAVKGIVPGDYKTAIEWLHDFYNLSFSDICMISGPSHAEEVSLCKLSYLTIVCPDASNARRVGESLANDYVHISYSDDLYGVEYAVVLKNIYAIAAGIATGLGYGDNFKAVLVAASADEMSRFINESYPYDRNTCEAAYLGDLLVTCYSAFSRNRRFGQLIGQGLTVKSALNEMTMVAEGYFAADCIRHLNLRHKVSMPIAEMVYGILYKGIPARQAMADLTDKL